VSVSKVRSRRSSLREFQAVGPELSFTTNNDIMAMPKLLYILRTAGWLQLQPFISRTSRDGLGTILNVDLNDNQWLQASLGGWGWGVSSDAGTFCPSGFSCINTPSLLQQFILILPDSINALNDQSTVSTEVTWSTLSCTSLPLTDKQHIHGTDGSK